MAASDSVPSRPTIITSTKLIDICESWTSTRGTARPSVARTSDVGEGIGRARRAAKLPATPLLLPLTPEETPLQRDALGVSR